jgi:hypothetical protein
VGAETYGTVKSSFKGEALRKLLIGSIAIRVGEHPQKVTSILDILHQVEMMR